MERTDRVILHCDCNAFYASVECLLHPAYRDVPMAVCGDPENRRDGMLPIAKMKKDQRLRSDSGNHLASAAEVSRAGACSTA